VLPHPVRRAVVLDGLEEWRSGLRLAGVEVAEGLDDHRPLDLVVSTGRHAATAGRANTRSVIVEGSRDGPLRRRDFRTRRLLLRPARERPTLALPLDPPGPVSYAVERWSVVDRRWKSARMRGARMLVSRGLFPSWASPVVTVASRDEGPPTLVAAARELGVPGDVNWFLTFGQGDALSRNAFQLFRAGSSRPDWILKFARIAGYRERFDDDERGLRLAHAAGDIIAAHVPRLVGRFDVDGLHASLETAATGRRLRDALRAPGDRAGKLGLVERIADWILSLGRLNTACSEATAAERDRLRRDVVPRWRELGVDASLVENLPPLAGVTQHNDLGTWNVVTDAHDFTVVDWENAREAGFPLWDLVYFLTDALVLLDGSDTAEHLPARMARLFAGEAPTSTLLFAWVRRAVAAAAVPADSVGAIVTLCWLSHSQALDAHKADLAVRIPHDPARLHGLEGMARAWMDHPALGPTWSVWRA
jgi:Ser/Thr protein kinase RdoA (MazF antagonist)